MATVTSEPDDLKTDLKEDKEDKVIIYLYSNYNHGLYSITYVYVHMSFSQLFCTSSKEALCT